MQDSSVEIVLTFLVVPAVERNHGFHAPSRPLVGIHLQGFVQPSLGPCCIGLRQPHLCLQGVVFGLLRPLANHYVERGVSPFVGFQFHLTQHKIVPIAIILRIDGGGPCVIGLGLIEGVKVDSAKGTQRKTVFDIRIALDGTRAVCLGPLVVFKIEFGQPAEEIRLRQERLGANDHVEALDGEYVVLVV